MGRYINPGNDGFAEIVKSSYVDKTGIIDIINNTINTTNKLICISRPRRFGKSYAAKTICAYYDCSVDSHEVFDGFDISKTPQYEESIQMGMHRNRCTHIHRNIRVPLPEVTT